MNRKTVREVIDHFSREMLDNFNGGPTEIVLPKKILDRLVSEVWLKKEDNTSKSLYPRGSFSMYCPNGILKITVDKNDPDLIEEEKK